MLATAKPEPTAIARSVLFSIIRPARVGRLPRRPVVRHRIPPIIPSVPRIWRANATVSPIVTPSEAVRAWLRTVLRLVKFTTALNTARTGSISAFQLDQQFGSFGFGSGLSHDFAPVHRLALAFGHACRTIR